MAIEHLQNTLPDFAKDIRLNLSSVLNSETMTELNQQQIAGISLASAYATRDKKVTEVITAFATSYLSANELEGIKAAATIMSMNNIYYRFTHSMQDEAYHNMPAKLRMNVMANPPVDKIIFELSSVAVSAINGCSKCLNAHATGLEKLGITKSAIQSAVRIASVIFAAGIACEIAE